MIGVPNNMRRVNERVVFDRLLRHGPASRAELAKLIRLSPPTVGKVVDDLLGAGLLEEVMAGEGDTGVVEGGSLAERGEAGIKPGRPGRTVRLNRSRAGIVAVQLGVHHTRVAALPVAGPMGEDWPVKFETPEKAADWVRGLRKAIKPLAGVIPWAVMVSVPGVVDEQAGKVLLAPNLHWLEQADLPGMLRGVWDAPVKLVQEIRALALGHVAVNPGERDFLLVDVGAGVGGAAVMGGRLFTSSLALSGELGHTAVVGNKRECGCGGKGCVETLVSRPGLYLSFPNRRGEVLLWTNLIRRIREMGEESWWCDSVDGLGVVIGGAMNVLGVKHVVVTGALTELPAVVMQRLERAVQGSALWARFGEVRCEAAPRHWARGLVSAAIDRVILPRPADEGSALQEGME